MSEKKKKKPEEIIATICRREGINPNLYYRWSKSFLEAGKKRLSRDTQREATTGEVTELRQENEDLKKLLAETYLENRLIKTLLPKIHSPKPDR